MDKSLVVYFSQGGSTERVAQAIGSGLGSAGHEVTLCNLRDESPPSPAGYDLLGVGSPTYYYRLPFNVTSYLDGLPNLGGMPTYAFILHGTYRGDSGRHLLRGLAKKGARPAGYLHSFGTGTFYGYFRQGHQFSPGHPTEPEMAAAEAFGRGMAARAATAGAADAMGDPGLAAIYRLERWVTNRWLARNLYSRLFRVDKAKCKACGTCVRDCPVHNIKSDAQGHPTWGRDCILCLYCEMNCPQEAISSPVSLPVFTPFLKYNVWAGARDPSLDHRRATVDHGKLKVLG